MRGHLLAASPQRGDHVARVDEVESSRIQLAVEQIIDDELDVGDSFRLQKRPRGAEQPFVDVGTHDPAGRADPVPKDPKPAQCPAADVQGTSAGAARQLREEVSAGGFPDARLQLQALQLRGLVC